MHVTQDLEQSRGRRPELARAALPVDPLSLWAAECRPGWSLPGPFYSHEAVYRQDVENIWRRGWLFAGHTCEIPKPGDYFTMQVDTDSLILIRSENGTIQGLH